MPITSSIDTINNQDEDSGFQPINKIISPESFGEGIPGIKEDSVYDVLWQQNNIGAGILLSGLFEFKVGVDKKTQKVFCNIAGVSKLNVLEFVRLAGFRKRYLKDSNSYLMVRAKDNIMEPVTIDLIRVEAYAEMKRNSWIEIEIGDLSFTYDKDILHTIYLKNQDQIFNKNFLELMEGFDIPELEDGREDSYFLFSNCIIKVGKNSTETIPYNKLSTLNRCVWKSHIMGRNYKSYSGYEISEFEKFICNVSNNDPSRISAFKSAIGYLLHNYNGSHMGQAVVCYDEKPTDRINPQGGTGKGLFGQAIAWMREMAKIDGKHFKADDKFRYQTVNVTSQIVFIDDLCPNVPFEVFFSCLTDGWTIERKHMDTIKLSPEDSPKMLFSMNTIINGNGSSHRRRMFILEFSDHYSRQITTGNEHPIEDEHGIFFDRINWTDRDWNLFTAYMINCLSFYLQNDLQPYNLINVGKNALIQTTGEDFAEWTEEKQFVNGEYYKTKDLFEDYRNRYYGADAVDYKQRSFTNNLKKYAGIKGLDFDIRTDQVTKLSEFAFKEKTH